MRAGIGVDRITVWQGDITKLEVDAVVNAANDEAAFTGQRQRKRDGRPSAIVKCNALLGVTLLGLRRVLDVECDRDLLETELVPILRHIEPPLFNVNYSCRLTTIVLAGRTGPVSRYRPLLS